MSAVDSLMDAIGRAELVLATARRLSDLIEARLEAIERVLDSVPRLEEDPVGFLTSYEIATTWYNDYGYRLDQKFAMLLATATSAEVAAYNREMDVLMAVRGAHPLTAAVEIAEG